MQQIETGSPTPQNRPKTHRPRSSPRRGVNRRAVISLPRTGKPHPVLLVDVSSGGACVQADVQLNIGDEILLRAEFNPEIRIAVTAVVIDARSRRKTLYGLYGLRFTGVDEAAELALAAFIGSDKRSA
jgi:hypothetical protein